MEARSARKRSMTPLSMGRIWVLFGILLVTVMVSGVVGTQSVRADSACTWQACNSAYTFAQIKCQNYGGVIQFECPGGGDGLDDFSFFCGLPSPYDAVPYDCVGHGPS